MLNPWLGIFLVATSLAGLIAALHVFQKSHAPHPELVRKLLHITMGLVALSFPWIFAASWPVWVLAIISMSGLLMLKAHRGLKKQLGNVIHGIQRESLGELYFPLAVAILFDITEGNAILFCVPVLVLALADATAALVGVFYGKLHYTTAEGDKSIEGSVAFFFVTFLSVHIPLLLFTDTSRVDTLLIGFIMGFLIMLFEAIAWRGLDNLFIPLGGYVLLASYLDMHTIDLSLRLVAIVLLVGFMSLIRRKTTLDHSAVLGAILVAYVSWTYGGWSWLVPPFLLLIAYTYFAGRSKQYRPDMHNIHAVVSVSAAGLIWLLLGEIYNAQQLLLPFTVAFAAQLTMINIARISYRRPQWLIVNVLFFSIFQAWLIIFAPYVVLHGFSAQSLVHSVAGLGGVVSAAIMFARFQPHLNNCPIDAARWWRQGIIGGLASLTGLIALNQQLLL